MYVRNCTTYSTRHPHIFFVFSYRVSLGAFEPPDSASSEDGVLPKRFAIFTHKMIITSRWELVHIGDVVEDAPETLCGGHSVNFFQVGLILCRSGVLQSSVINDEGYFSNLVVNTLFVL